MSKNAAPQHFTQYLLTLVVRKLESKHQKYDTEINFRFFEKQNLWVDTKIELQNVHHGIPSFCQICQALVIYFAFYHG